MIRACKICGTCFNVKPSQVKRGAGITCSRKCQGEWQSKYRSGENSPTWKGGKVAKLCIECGKEFKVEKGRIKKGHGEFCSRKCYGAWKSKNNIGPKSSHWKGGGIKRICDICRKEFLISTYGLKQGFGKFCSRECYSISQRGGIKINQICKICGNEFYLKPSSVARGWGKVCSKRCANVWQSKNTRGSNSPSWKGGLTPERNRIQMSQEYKKWRQSIFARDNFTCQKCGDNAGGKLNAHHIKRFSVMLNDIKQKFPLLSISDVAANYPDLWDTANGITLCEKCHIEAHKKLTLDKKIVFM